LRNAELFLSVWKESFKMSFMKRYIPLIMAVALFAGFGMGRINAADLSAVTIKASSLVPGETGRYTLSFRSGQPLKLAPGSVINVEFPAGFSLACRDINDPEPGCTLTKLEFKNPKDKHYAVVTGEAKVKNQAGGAQLEFTLHKANAVVAPDVDIHLSIPGITNKNALGGYAARVEVRDAEGAVFSGMARYQLGLPPAAVPRNLHLTGSSSYQVSLAWEPVPEAKRYQVLFSRTINGQYLQAVDMTREPLPGEEWLLQVTKPSFAARGNGGLEPGRTYFFKVRAGNEFGFGPYSKPLAVSMPVVELLNCSPADKTTKIISARSGNQMSATLDQPVKIADQDRIQVYEKVTGTRIIETKIVVDPENLNTVRITAPLKPGTEHLVVFYEGALESSGQPKVVNRMFGWTFTTAAETKRGN
jgi:hypothetical protein